MTIIVTLGVDLGQRRDPSTIVAVQLTAETGAGGRRRYVHVVRFAERMPLGTPYPDVAARVGQVYRHIAQLARVSASSRGDGSMPFSRHDGMVRSSRFGAVGGIRPPGSPAVALRRSYTPDPDPRHLWAIPGPVARFDPYWNSDAGGLSPAETIQHVAGLAGQQRRPTGPTVKLLVDSTGVGVPVLEFMRGLGLAPVPCFFTYGDRLIANRDGSLTVGKGHLVSRLQALLQGRRLKLPETPEARTLASELLTFEIRTTDKGNETSGAFSTGAHDDLVTALGLACLREPAPFAAAAGGQRGPRPTYTYQRGSLR